MAGINGYNTTSNVSISSDASDFTVFNIDWAQSLIAAYNILIWNIIGLLLNLTLFVVSLKNKRADQDTYRMIIFYEIILAATISFGNIVSFIGSNVIFSPEYYAEMAMKQTASYEIYQIFVNTTANYADTSLQLLMALFAINIFTTVILPNIHSRYMTTLKVHAYCLLCLKFCLLHFIFAQFEQSGFAMTILLAVITIINLSTAIICNLIVYFSIIRQLRIETNSERKQFYYENLWLATSSILQGIYTFFDQLPLVVYQFINQIDSNYYDQQYSTNAAFCWWINAENNVHMAKTTYMAIIFFLTINVYQRFLVGNSKSRHALLFNCCCAYPKRQVKPA